MPRDPALEAILTRPPAEVGEALARLPEGQWLDRKSIRIKPGHLAQTEVAMANAEGGSIVIGVHDGRIEGTDDHARHRNDLIQAAIDHTEPPVRARFQLVECRNTRGDPDHLLILDIHTGDTVHATVRDEVFLLILDLVRGDRPVGTGDVAQALGVTSPTAIRYLNAMKDAGLIDWVGKSPSDPRAHWRLHSE